MCSMYTYDTQYSFVTYIGWLDRVDTGVFSFEFDWWRDAPSDALTECWVLRCMTDAHTSGAASKARFIRHGCRLRSNISHVYEYIGTSLLFIGHHQNGEGESEVGMETPRGLTHCFQVLVC